MKEYAFKNQTNHLHNSFVPTPNNLPHANRELKWASSVPAGIKFIPIWR
jgi:hypothetical protein